ncbi:MAG: lysophospholipase L1-like esterase [Verrucomicrobiales bacterium]|jgi:lysophospholipase L1-like esterase
MKIISLLAVATLVPALSAQDDDYPLREAVECNSRGGVANFLAKVESGKAVKVAYLGGSITAAPGWRIQSREWLQARYPDAKIEEIHAAIGGTGSDLGVFRLGQDVLRHEPDLLFVEFAVNDGRAAPERIHKAMEGIVRQTWTADPQTDICFVYTLTEKMLPDLHAGKMPRAASAMEELADHYGIPSIHFGVEVARLEAAGELIFKAEKPKDFETVKPMIFSTDGVHPHAETGHRLYTEAIARSWPKLTGPAGSRVAVEPLRADNWEQAKLIPIEPGMLSGNWEKLDAEHPIAKRFARNMPTIYQATEPGAALTFKFDGTTAAVFDVLGPDGGSVAVQLDEADAQSRNRIDAYSTYNRMSKLNVATEIDAGAHTVTVTLTSEKLDKREILFERNRADFDAKPDKYTNHTWYAASLLILGDLISE